MDDQEAKVEDKIQPLLERISFPGKIHLITNDQELSAAAEMLITASELGFDTETRPSFKKGEVYKVALLQLATDADAFLIRLHGISNFKVLKTIFENKAVLKVGQAIGDDIKLLRKTFEFEPHNFIELQDIAKAQNLKNFGLKGMTAEVLNAALSKGPKTSNWEARVLTRQQELYAATDAWIGLKLYRKLVPQLQG